MSFYRLDAVSLTLSPQLLEISLQIGWNYVLHIKLKSHTNQRFGNNFCFTLIKFTKIQIKTS